jgi:GEVED domain/Secretion system C-terminal sorting domain
MKKPIIVTVCFILLAFSFAFGQKSQPAYKAMMEDNTFNFYTVCDSAEAYFKTIDISVKGSGYKPYLRWKQQNEAKFYPTGNRNVDLLVASKEFARLNNEQNQHRLFQSGGWKSLGPDSISRITGHYAAGLGQVCFVEVCKTDAQRMYMCSRSGGMWATNNGGASWSHATDYLPNVGSGVNVLSASPTNFDSILMNVRNAENGTSHGIFRSIDGGASFTPTAFVPSNPAMGFGGLGSNFKINVIRYHPRIPNLIFIGTNRGIYRSVDNLETWVRLYNDAEVRDIEFHPTNNNIVYVYESYFLGLNRNKILKSIDQGLNFVGMADFPGNNNAFLNISVLQSNPNDIVVASTAGLWKSFDAGANFIATLSPPPAGTDLFYATPNDLDPSKFVSGYVNAFRSTDGGSNFNQCTWWSLGSAPDGSFPNGNGTLQQNYDNSNRYIHADIQYITCVNGIFYACTDGFLCKSNDNGSTWQKLNLSTGIRENYRVGIAQSNTNVAICGSQDNGISLLTETDWNERYGADGMDAVVHPLNYNWMIGNTQNGSPHRTQDGGTTLADLSRPELGMAWVAPLLVDPNNQMTVYSFGKNVFKSTAFGSNWVQLGTSSTFAGNAIENAAIAENNSNLIVISRQDKIELSSDGGLTFASIKSNLPTNSITDIAFDPKKDSTIVVTYNNYQNISRIWITKNLGQNWQNITYNLGLMPVLSVIIDNTDSSTIYLGAELGVYKKSMNAVAWTLYNQNLPNVACRDLKICHGSNTIKAATWGRGLWEYSLADRNAFPAIVKTEITSPVTFDSPKTTVLQYVTSEIDYSGTLTSVFVRWAINTPTFTVANTIPMSLVSGNSWKSNTSLPDFPAGTKVFFKVFAVGESNDTTETYKFMYELHPFEFCATAPEVDPGNNIHITRFTLANVNNASTNTNYISYPNLPVVLYTDSTYTATARFNMAVTGTTDFYVWIDYNRDGVFDASEKTVNRIDFPFTAPNYTTNGTFTVPANAIEDTIMLRARYARTSGGNSPCDNSRGEVEDYPVIIRKAPVISFSGNTSFCEGSNLNLMYSGTFADSVKWLVNNGSNSFNFTGNNVSNTTLNTGTYSITITAYKYGVGFTKVFYNYFVVNSLPTVNAGSDIVLCQGISTTLTGTSNGNMVWSNGVLNNVPFTPSVSGVYTLTATSAENCVNTDVLNITVNALPTVNAGSDIVLCQGTSTTLTGTSNGNMVWSNGVLNNLPFTPSVSGVYTLTATSAENCINTDILNITVNSLPTVNAGSDIVLCQGISTTLTGTSNGNMVWSNGVLNNLPFTPSVSGVYTLTATSAENCINTDVLNITVNTLPTVNAGSDIVLCQGTATTLAGTSNGNMVWSNGVLNNLPFTPSVSRVYTLTATSAENCVNTDVLNITVNDLPNVIISTSNTLLCDGQTATLSAVGADSYTWNNGATTQTIAVTPSTTTTYTVTGLDVHQCSSTTSFNQIVNACAALADLGDSQNTKVYPNPVNNTFCVEFNNVQDQTRIEVVTVLGEIAAVLTTVNNLNSFNATNWATGIYFVKVIQLNKEEIFKLVKE